MEHDFLNFDVQLLAAGDLGNDVARLAPIGVGTAARSGLLRLLIVIPTVIYGGLSLLGLVAINSPGYYDNPVRHDLWRAGHAHAGVYLVLSLVMLRYVDEALLSPGWKWIGRTGAPIAAILIPAAFFLSVVSPTATRPNGLINLAYIGALFLAAAV